MKKKWFLISLHPEGTNVIVREEMNVMYGPKIKYKAFSISQPYDRKRDLIAGEKILDYKCKMCDGLIPTHYYEETREQLITRRLCFNCNFWYDKVLMKDLSTVARIDGKHYMIGDENQSTVFRGFGGRKFTIKFNDGREVTTTNLWHQGEIPERFRELLPDNAVFINE